MPGTVAFTARAGTVVRAFLADVNGVWHTPDAFRTVVVLLVLVAERAE